MTEKINSCLMCQREIPKAMKACVSCDRMNYQTASAIREGVGDTLLIATGFEAVVAQLGRIATALEALNRDGIDFSFDSCFKIPDETISEAKNLFKHAKITQLHRGDGFDGGPLICTIHGSNSLLGCPACDEISKTVDER